MSADEASVERWVKSFHGLTQSQLDADRSQAIAASDEIDDSLRTIEAALAGSYDNQLDGVTAAQLAREEIAAFRNQEDEIAITEFFATYQLPRSGEDS